MTSLVEGGENCSCPIDLLSSGREDAVYCRQLHGMDRRLAKEAKISGLLRLQCQCGVVVDVSEHAVNWWR